MATGAPRVLIIVLNYNGEKLLRPCLTSIREHTRYPAYDVVVVDNASPDGSLAIVEREFPWAEAVQNGANLGFAKGNNAILARYDADYYLLLNNDTEVTPGWLEALVEEAEASPGVGLVGGKLLFPDGRIQHAGGLVDPHGPRHHGYLAPRDTHNEARDVDYVTFACVLIKRAVVEKIGYLDESYSPMYYEDADYCLRARAAGFRVRYTPRSLVIHYENAASAKQPSRERLFIGEKNRLRFKMIHFPASWWLRSGWYEAKKVAGNARNGTFGVLARAWRANLADRRALREGRRHRDRFVPSAFGRAPDRHAPDRRPGLRPS